MGYCWQTPTAPEAGGKLAGGGAKRSHRKRYDRTTRPERASDRDWSCREFQSGVPAGMRTNFFDLSRWLRFAPPPANFRRPSGAETNIAEFASSISPRRAPYASAFRQADKNQKDPRQSSISASSAFIDPVHPLDKRFPASAVLTRARQAEASSCLNASYCAIPTDVARFNDRIRGFGIGIFKQRSQFALSKSSGNPRVSLPKTRQSFG